MISGNKVKIIVVVILAIIIFLSLFLYINVNSKNTKFDNLIRNIDFSISSGSTDNTNKMLNLAENLAHSPLQYKRLLKRINLTANFHYLSLFAAKAHARYPKDESILSIYIFSLLETGDSERASKIVQSLNINTVNDGLNYETNISSGTYNADDNIFYQVLDDKNITLYKNLYQRTTSSKFLIDAGLLYLEKGKYEDANSILSKLPIEDLPYKKLVFLVKYYSGHLDEVLKMLSLYDFGFSIQEIQLIRIDILIKQKLYSNAGNAINNYIRIYPQYSAAPYTNLILLNSLQSDRDIDQDIKNALLYFPDNRKLLLSIIDYYIKMDRELSALSVLNNYLKRNAIDKELEIILKQLKGVDNPDYIVNSVRELVNKNKGKRESSRFLAFNLYKNNDMDKLGVFLDQTSYEQNEGWIIFFRALISSFKGNYLLAIEEFQSSFNIDNNWESLYNLAIISKYRNDYQSAISYFQTADNSIVDLPANMKTKSMIRTELALLFYELKDYDKAYRELKNSLDQDKTNLKANLLFNKLESSTY